MLKPVLLLLVCCMATLLGCNSILGNSTLTIWTDDGAVNDGGDGGRVVPGDGSGFDGDGGPLQDSDVGPPFDGYVGPVGDGNVGPVDDDAAGGPTIEDAGNGYLNAVFYYTGSAQSWVVPAGIDQVTVLALGASGGMACGGAAGGLGASIQATMSVTAGETLSVWVGGQGYNNSATNSCAFTGAAAFNGGGPGGGVTGQSTPNAGAGGGGGSDVRQGGTSLSARVVMAGGGGGSGGGSGSSLATQGGMGGAGGNGSSSDPAEVGGPGRGAGSGGAGGGGLGNAGGMGGTSGNGSVGTTAAGNGGPNAGGNGGQGAQTGGGGGGGGFFGGGGGGGGADGGAAGGGGGGSSFAVNALSSFIEDGVNTGDGQVTITYQIPGYDAGTGTCGGNPCSGSCIVNRCLVTIAGGLDSPNSIAIDSSNIYWTSATGVMRAPLDGGEATSIASAAGYSLSGIAVNSTDIYWTNGSLLLTAQLDGGGGFPLGYGNNAGPLSGGVPNVLLTDEAAFWSVNNGLFGVLLDGGSLATISTNIAGGGLASDSTNLYWFDSHMNVVSAPLPPSGNPTMPGAALSTIASANSTPASELAVSSGNVYWTDNSTGDVSTSPILGSGTVTLASEQGAAAGIAVDSTNVYWVTPNSVVTALLNGHNPTTLYTGFNWVGNASWPGANIAVDGTSVYWTIMGDGGMNGSIMKLTPK